MKHRCILPALLLLVVRPATSAVVDSTERITLSNGRLSVALSKPAKGAVLSLVDAAGREMAVPARSLFRLVLARAGTPPGERFTLAGDAATEFHARVSAGTATLEYSGFDRPGLRVTCTASVRDGDPLVRWRLSAVIPAGLVLEEAQFPLVLLRTPLGAGGDAVVAGATKGGLYRPADWKPGAGVSFRQPGSLAAQFACCYDARGGFYAAAYDGRARPKEIRIRRTPEGIEAGWAILTYASGSYDQGFDIVTSAFSGGPEPADWRDAADLYRAWAATQPWCARAYARRQDIPAWMKAGPAMVRFNRSWLADPERIERWVSECWSKSFQGIPLITAYWGWEKHETWVTPDYFPVFPSDAQFRALVARTRKAGCHAFAWPSGYHWTLTYGKRPDGSFAWDDRERFDRIGRPHAVYDRAGGWYHGARSWLQGGETSCLCPGDPWTIAWWNNDVAAPLARRGCELIQADQVVGGSFPFCYRAEHGHPAGPGPWMADAFARQLATMRDTCRKIEPDSVVCFEEPNERFNHLAGIQDYRDCESPAEWASVFNYLYHDVLPTFQSNPRAGDLVMLAHCVADGQMPHFRPESLAGPTPAPANGGFEAGGAAGFDGWDKVPGYQGQVWNGKAFRDTAVRHAGAASLRLENDGEETVQVSQNVPVSSELAVGRRYRLSAWLRTERLARENAINLATFADGMQPTGAGGRLPFPPAGPGWVRAAAEFVVPERSALLRIMIHVAGPAKVWVDDVSLEEVRADGTTAPVILRGNTIERRLIARWVELYHGAGRPYLLLGRTLHPPKLVTEGISYRGRKVPAVAHNAFRAPDGSEAVVLANATDARQAVRLTWKGRETALELAPGDARLVR